MGGLIPRDTVWRFGANAATTLHSDATSWRTRAEPEESLTICLVSDAPRPGSGYADMQGRLRIVSGATELSTTRRLVP